MNKNKMYVVGIAGGTGCGKSTIIKAINESFPKDTTVLNLDNYYKAHPDLSYEQKTKLNYDSPDAFDVDLFMKHIKKLKSWQCIEAPIYDYTIHDRTKETKTVNPNSVLIIDGLFTLYYYDLLDMLDFKIYIHVDADERILRRIKRDLESRGRTLDSVITQYLTTVKPMHEKYISRTKKNADIIVPQGAFNKIAIETIINQISACINK